MEKWKDITGYVGLYQVSNHGRVRSLDRLVKGSFGNDRLYPGNTLKPGTTMQGYRQVSLSKLNKVKRISVHRLVASAFINSAKDNLVVNHINGNKLDNSSKNLEWCSAKQNSAHFLKYNPKNGLRNVAVRCLKNNKKYKSMTHACKELGLDKAALSSHLRHGTKAQRGINFERVN